MAARPQREGRWRTVAGYVVGALVVIVAFDVAVAIAFSIPDGQKQPQGKLQRYFNYGESLERKLERTVGQPGEEPEPIVQAGWVGSELFPPERGWADAERRVVVYGMSFTNHVAAALREADPGVSVVTRAGPSAPLSHSLAMFDADPYRGDADEVVVGVLSSSLPYLQSMTGLGFTFESPAPYTFPNHELRDGQPQRVEPVITDGTDFINAFRARGDSERWRQHLDRLREHDAYWDDAIYGYPALDASAFTKLLRRAWAARNVRRRAGVVYSPQDGYALTHPAVAAVPLMLEAMQERCVRDGQGFTVLLLHARGEPGHLDAWLRPELDARGIRVISTNDLFRSTDAMNFLEDGHYRPELDRGIAEALLEQFDSESEIIDPKE